MKHQDPIITAIRREIGDQKVLQAVLDKHTESGQPMMSILREENFLDEEQVIRVIAAGNGIEFIDLSADMDISERRLGQDGHISLVHNGHD